MTHPDDRQFPNSTAWWQTRTHDQLQELIKPGFAGGESFDGALREMQRRIRDSELRDREAAQANVQQREERKGRVALWAAIASLLVAIAAVVKLLIIH